MPIKVLFVLLSTDIETARDHTDVLSPAVIALPVQLLPRTGNLAASHFTTDINVFVCATASFFKSGYIIIYLSFIY